MTTVISKHFGTSILWRVLPKSDLVYRISFDFLKWRSSGPQKLKCQKSWSISHVKGTKLGVEPREYLKDLEYRLYHRLSNWIGLYSKFSKPISYFLGVYLAWYLSINCWNSLDHDLMASIWEKAILISTGYLNSGLSYLITAVPTLYGNSITELYPYWSTQVPLGIT